MSSKNNYRDPNADREEAQYERPVPSREVFLQLLNDQGRPMSEEQVLEQLEIDDEAGREGIHRRLRAMVRDGQLVQNRRERFGLPLRMDLIAGRVQGHRDGFGFLIPDDRNQDDYFLPPKQMRSVLDGDRVMVSAEGRGRSGKREARVVEILQRSTTELVGLFFREGGVDFIEPQNRKVNQNVVVVDRNDVTPGPGAHVRAEILHYPDHESTLQVRLLEVIAAQDEPGMEVDVALRRYEIPHEWPEAVEQEAARVPGEVPDADKQGRYDLRDLPLVTVDDESARDFDDAIYVEKRWRGGWRLIVAIADVSHYVHPGMALDEEAEKRGNSVYFPNRVIPMLPEVLSNGLCSLNPDVDRLCLCCDMQISKNGRITKHTFREGVMRSRQRLTYTKVGALIEEPEGELARQLQSELDPSVLKMIGTWYELYQVQRQRRRERGAADFDTVDTRIIQDENQKIQDIVPVQHNVAHTMIEEAMLAANISTAQLMEKSGLPILFRNHEPPTEEKLESLQAFLGGLGLSLPWSSGDEVTPTMFRELTEQIEGRTDRNLIQSVMLRTFTQARYEAENKGHFGLSYRAYTHFTSPIRRYPDLLVHRTLRYLIRKKDFRESVENPGKLAEISKDRIVPYDRETMAQLGEHCSMTERRADEATRDVEQWLKCQYMQQHLGAEFEGVVSGVAGFGLFVTLSELYIDGMVHVSSLESDYYHHDDVRHALVGESSGRMFRLGDEVRVQVAGVNVEDRKIDLMMIRGADHDDKRGGKRQGRQGKGVGDGTGGKKSAPRKQSAPGKKSAGKKAANKKAATGKKAAAKKTSASKETPEKAGSQKAAKKSSRGGRGRRKGS
jgi:ribonuclease R